MIDELFECDAISLTKQIKTGIVEASDILSASIARAERLNTSLHAIVNFWLFPSQETAGKNCA